MILAGDVGGTKTRLALFENQKVIFLKKYLNADFSSFHQIVHQFLQEAAQKPLFACFGIAGPIQKGIVKTTNLPWTLSQEELQKELGIESLFLINDLEANALGIELLKPEDLYTLHPGIPEPKGHKALLSVGTGLGEAALYYGNRYLPFASEGGHSDFAPQTLEEVDLYFFLKKKFGHVSFERVLSGQGLLNLYLFLTQDHPPLFFGHDDPAKVISQKAKEDPLCEKALLMMTAFWGQEAGNLALKMLAKGGVYFGGGIAPKMIEYLIKPLFFERFKSKGRMEEFLQKIPLYIILNEETALLGASQYAFLKKEQKL